MMDSSKINFEKKAVLPVTAEWPDSYWLFHVGCTTEKNSIGNNNTG